MYRVDQRTQRYIRYTFSTRSFEWLFISFHFHRINCVRHGYSVCYRVWCSVRVSHIQGCCCFLRNNQEKPIEFSEHPKAVPINDIASKRLHNHLHTFTSFCELKQNECRSAQPNSLAHRSDDDDDDDLCTAEYLIPMIIRPYIRWAFILFILKHENYVCTLYFLVWSFQALFVEQRSSFERALVHVFLFMRACAAFETVCSRMEMCR